MAIFDIITDKHPNFRWTQCVNVHLFIIVKHSSGGRVQAARPCGWPRVAGAAVGELVVPGPRQGGLHTAAVPGLNILYINSLLPRIDFSYLGCHKTYFWFGRG